MMLISRRSTLLIGMTSALSIGGYILASYLTYSIGFPLDDAWIHQTYARNLALTGEWAFITGILSGGSTGPLWGILLAVGYYLGMGPYVWSFILGWLSLWGLGVIGIGLFENLCPDQKKYSVLIGVLITLEWHLVWMAVSGMETLLYSFVITLVLDLLLKPQQKHSSWFWIGVMVGVSVWLRPDGVTILGPAVFVIYFMKTKLHEKLGLVGMFLLGFSLVFVPYLGFNQVVAGSVWPNTFFAKQAEYAELRQTPFLFRLWQQIQLPLVGTGITIVPGLFIIFGDSARKRQAEKLGIIIWLLVYLAIYAWRLPVTYQHGRYVMPVMPVFFVFSLAGLASWLFKDVQSRPQFFLTKSWLGAIIAITVLFWLLGARAYGRDVGVIESEMVTVAKWLNQNTPRDARIAVHDIGAIGYFGNRRLLDLAGLISPEVIPFIRDENRLGEYLDGQKADYLVTFPGWYPTLVGRATLIFQTAGNISPSLGGENMAVYKWQGAK